MTAAAVGYTVGGLGMAALTYELYHNVTYARGMNIRVRRVEVPADSTLRKIPTDWLTSVNGKVLGTDAWTIAPRNQIKLKNPNDHEELFLLYANALLQSPALSWELFLSNLKNGVFQWSQPWINFAVGDKIGAYTVSNRTPTAATLQWSGSGNAVEGQTAISLHPDQPAALFQLGSTIYKREVTSEGSTQSAINTHMNYLRLVLAQTYTTMEVCSKVAHESSKK